VSGDAATRLLTAGHGTLPAARLAELVTTAGVSSLVDVRTAPGSRHNPQFARAAMSEWLSEAGIAYRWDPRLGGFRRAAPDSPNTGLRHPAFRGYADHMTTAEFRAALDDLLDQARSVPTTVMCSESVWWRCHRRLIADAAVLLGGAEVLHLMHDGSLRPHVPTDGVRRQGEVLVYEAPQLTLPGALADRS
jgi:uncharacterized protein (DUF488 family)